MKKLLLERAATMTWEIVDLFNNYDEIDEWIKENYGVTFDDFKTEIEEEEGYTPTKQDWYDEHELNIREVESKNL
jgi:hypothetical protein